MLADVLMYDEHSPSKLRWIVRQYNRHHAMDPAGNQLPSGYWRVKYKGRSYLVHRVVWELHNGPIPDGIEIDHKDTDPGNNLITNLRLATRSNNKHNRKIGRNNTSGYKGVSFMKSKNKWRAELRLNSKRIWYEDHVCKETAYAAYCKAAMQYHKDFARVK